ncbi:hypothetical protein Patl1_36793 [Pistacia atlantica]|nr:hypothetical protein Patl1_36793 [Pistacia atlantica]
MATLINLTVCDALLFRGDNYAIPANEVHVALEQRFRLLPAQVALLIKVDYFPIKLHCL